MPAPGTLTFTIPEDEAGMRLDLTVAAHVAEITRSHAAALIRKECVRVDGDTQKPSYKVRTGQQISVNIPALIPAQAAAEAINLEIIFEDNDLLVINKPAGLVIHPAAGHAGGTLVNALLYHCPDMAGIGGSQRPGIVHRLDKDTSGLVVVAKNDQAHHFLSRQFKERSVLKIYQAIVHGVPKAEKGTIELPVGRHPADRKRMAVTSPRGRSAMTLWRVKERFGVTALLEFDLRTGRTHQIRVHCQAFGHPIVGDPVYGLHHAQRLVGRTEPVLHRIISGARRQMLHARKLGFTHPGLGNRMLFETPLPEDMREMIEKLRHTGAGNSV
jgi:23S rRNA pseudouridine1911/1915/1917 synthase